MSNDKEPSVEAQLASIHEWISGHEKRCEDRLKSINDRLTWILGAIVGLVVGLLGWALLQLYILEPLRVLNAANAQQQQQPFSVGVSVQPQQAQPTRPGRRYRSDQQDPSP